MKAKNGLVATLASGVHPSPNLGRSALRTVIFRPQHPPDPVVLKPFCNWRPLSSRCRNLNSLDVIWRCTHLRTALPSRTAAAAAEHGHEPTLSSSTVLFPRKIPNMGPAKARASFRVLRHLVRVPHAPAAPESLCSTCLSTARRWSTSSPGAARPKLGRSYPDRAVRFPRAGLAAVSNGS